MPCAKGKKKKALATPREEAKHIAFEKEEGAQQISGYTPLKSRVRGRKKKNMGGGQGLPKTKGGCGAATTLGKKRKKRMRNSDLR